MVMMMMHSCQGRIHKLHAVGKVTGLMMQCLVVAGQPGGNRVAWRRFNLIEGGLIVPLMLLLDLLLLVEEQSAGVAVDQVRGITRIAGGMDLGTYVLVWKTKKRTELVEFV